MTVADLVIDTKCFSDPASILLYKAGARSMTSGTGVIKGLEVLPRRSGMRAANFHVKNKCLRRYPRSSCDTFMISSAALVGRAFVEVVFVSTLQVLLLKRRLLQAQHLRHPKLLELK